MALTAFPKQGASGPRTSTGPATIRAAGTVTSATFPASNIPTTWVSALGYKTLVLDIDYTKGDETSVELEVVESGDEGVTWRPVLVVQTPNTAGVSLVTAHQLQLVGDTSGLVDIDVDAKTLIGVIPKRTGGTGAGSSLTVKASGGIVAVAA